ncbi:prevent-host-death family protein [Candidatus Symbiobacter mobilis CR]|uniref:Prevent-host-death family protein n=2 Tax=Candidatus Symbiobacter TaxID=1436289 RepID=U5N766_9BURK|nr:prevent-host-death family protein [Candidatus Symbiobacter mobilis CR]
MKFYTLSEARQKFASVLDIAKLEGAVRITRRDGRSFLLSPEKESCSPLDVQGVQLHWSREDIIHAVREGRDRQNHS